MPTIDCRFEGGPGMSGSRALVLFGPTLRVQIGFDADFQPDGGVQLALVDTGALDSCIDSSLAMELKLPIIGRQRVAGAHGAGDLNMHLARIHIPDLQGTLFGMFAGVHLAAGGQPHAALLGRSFLQNFTMTYDGRKGIVTLGNE